MAEDIWASDLRALDAICAADAAGDDCHQAAVKALFDAGVNENVISRRLRALAESGFIDAAITSYANDEALVHVRRPLERARRATHQWPSDHAGDDLIELIAARMAVAETAEERSRWQRLLDASKGLGGKAITEISIAPIERQLGVRSTSPCAIKRACPGTWRPTGVLHARRGRATLDAYAFDLAGANVQLQAIHIRH